MARLCDREHQRWIAYDGRHAGRAAEIECWVRDDNLHRVDAMVEGRADTESDAVRLCRGSGARRGLGRTVLGVYAFGGSGSSAILSETPARVVSREEHNVLDVSQVDRHRLEKLADVARQAASAYARSWAWDGVTPDHPGRRAMPSCSESLNDAPTDDAQMEDRVSTRADAGGSGVTAIANLGGGRLALATGESVGGTR